MPYKYFTIIIIIIIIIIMFMYILSHVQSTIDLTASLDMIIAGLCIRRLHYCLMAYKVSLKPLCFEICISNPCLNFQKIEDSPPV